MLRHAPVQTTAQAIALPTEGKTTYRLDRVGSRIVNANPQTSQMNPNDITLISARGSRGTEPAISLPRGR
jgi:hypothetical protein